MTKQELLALMRLLSEEAVNVALSHYDGYQISPEFRRRPARAGRLERCVMRIFG
jgi:hypothetical protein